MKSLVPKTKSLSSTRSLESTTGIPASRLAYGHTCDLPRRRKGFIGRVVHYPTDPILEDPSRTRQPQHHGTPVSTTPDEVGLAQPA